MAKGIPKYLREGLRKQDLETLESIQEMVERLIKEANEPPAPEEIQRESSEEVVDRQTAGAWTLQKEKVNCNKDDCYTCPHGPYVYGYRREGGKVKSKYFGKVDIEDAIEELAEDGENVGEKSFLKAESNA